MESIFKLSCTDERVDWSSFHATDMRRERKKSIAIVVFLFPLIVALYGLCCTWGDQSRSQDDSLRTPCIAVTFDDLPGVGALHDGETRLEMNRRLLKNLSEREVKATGFVNCARIQENDEILEAWLDAGMELGNHTSNHLDINAVDIGTWIEDVRTCDEFLRRSSGDSIRYFRYPMLHRGDTIVKREAGYEALKELGISIASVSVDNSESIVSRAYSEAIQKNDRDAQREVAGAYVGHIIDAIEHYQDVAHEVCGRDISHIVLLHVNTLAADQLGELLDALSAKDFSFISLEEALLDPVYSRKDVYIGVKGLSWLYRIEEDGERRVVWDDKQADDLTERLIRR
jgi:peptidoglycan/xylan/chitin deacetylase (PgdA/CDA1 family)